MAEKTGINPAEFDQLWKGPVIRTGVVTVLIPMFLCFLPCLYLYVYHGVFPSLTAALEGWGMVAAVYGAFYIVEPISYYPVLGMTGTYISFLSGNIGNLRVPCAALALEVVGEESGTPEAEMVSTLGLTGSVVTNLFFVSLAAVAGTAFLEALPLSIQNAFKSYTVPAIFGAMLAQFGMHFPVLVIFALGIPLFLLYAAPLMGLAVLSKAWIAIASAVFGTILIGRVFYKLKIIR